MSHPRTESDGSKYSGSLQQYTGSRYIPDEDHIPHSVEHETKETVARGKWGSAVEFFITSIGFAVGLGNVWRFPYKVYSNGGAVFLIPYALALIFLAIPLQMLEASIGQYSKKGPIGVWDTVPLLRGIGVATFYSTFIGIVYYNTPIAWGCYYFVRSMAAVLPWSTCNEWWAVDPCIAPTENLTNVVNTTAPVMFFYRDNLQITNDILNWGNFVWPLFICNVVIWLLLFAGISFGASTLGKVAYFTSLFPYVMLTVMIGYTATLPGAEKGIQFYLLDVDWSKLGEISVWRDAVSQVFYSTNCGFGASIQLASYNRFRHNILRDATLIPLLDGLTSIYAGFSVFTVLGYMAHVRGAEVKDVVSSGPGLIFITYAEAFSKIEGGNVWAVFFFFMVIILGLSSQFPVTEMCCSVISDSFPWFNKSRTRNLCMRAGLCIFGMGLGTIFVFGSGYYWYFLIDELVAAIPLMVIGLLELIGIGLVYSKPFCTSLRHKLIADIEKMIGPMYWTRWFWIITWTFIAPITIAFILLYDCITFPPLELVDYPWTVFYPENNGIYVMPDWSITLGWLMVSVCPIIVVIGAFWVACYDYNGYKAVFLATKPSEWNGADSRVQSRRNTNTMAGRPQRIVRNLAGEPMTVQTNTHAGLEPMFSSPPITPSLINTHLNSNMTSQFQYPPNTAPPPVEGFSLRVTPSATFSRPPDEPVYYDNPIKAANVNAAYVSSSDNMEDSTAF